MTTQLDLFPAAPATTAPVCLIRGTPMFRSARGFAVCGWDQRAPIAADEIGLRTWVVPYVHGKCWDAAKGAAT